jgi:hypothetical protein
MLDRKRITRVVERGAAAFLDGVEAAGDVGDLLEEELVHLQPVGRVGVRQQVVDHVVDAEVGETQRRMVVVQLEGAERVVSVWKASTRMSHMSRMCSAMSCGMPSAGRGRSGSVEGGAPALEFARAGLVDAALDVAHGLEVLVELLLVAAPSRCGAGRGRRRARHRARCGRRGGFRP